MVLVPRVAHQSGIVMVHTATLTSGDQAQVTLADLLEKETEVPRGDRLAQVTQQVSGA